MRRQHSKVEIVWPALDHQLLNIKVKFLYRLKVFIFDGANKLALFEQGYEVHCGWVNYYSQP